MHVCSVFCIVYDVWSILRYLGETGQHFVSTAENTKDMSQIGARYCLWGEKSTGGPGR